MEAIFWDKAKTQKGISGVLPMDELILNSVKKHKTNCPFKLASRLNITIMYEDLGKITKGFFHRRLRRNYIVLHYDQSYQQQRFAVGHELGHFFYDRGTSYFRIEQNSLLLPAKYERRANIFAVKLLCIGSEMNFGETIQSYFLRNGIPEEMHRYFQSNFALSSSMAVSICEWT
ncbi:ImmA/IrrE family metallo-endopeptidase [Paenibacillus eucommiae]|uniref:Zn-dependent peptidase ImmA (M78 family) n=1 Tax=Paenibacillus eucommiae TaxID=1355755 RepID=A0ABS4IRW3_9BACL|nr:ImmA/IrrE family metallo-endopeptidase [Paenibacillus eucommiae]MBP1990306.1 Zn-dependent peptidase ImmA (M78 family) [Paenibacillus eucommiae]